MYKKSLFIFRRDLRVSDNTGLIKALKSSDSVIPCFIFDPRQVGNKNDYKSDNAIQFMIESLKDLDKQLKGKLYIFYGNAETIISKIIKAEKVEAVFTNRDYTPFSTKRDKSINALCKKLKCEFEQYEDLLITNPDEIRTTSGTPYAVFSSFYNKVKSIPIPKPHKITSGKFSTKSIPGSQKQTIFKKVLPKESNDLHVNGGRTRGLKLLKKLNSLKNYKSTRDIPTENTSHLSAHNKFGTVSIREVYHAICKHLGRRHPLLKQLYWRDFFTHIAYHRPDVFGKPYKKQYSKIRWSNSKIKFKAWCEGKTGFPIVDAGMRQLNTTGFMHNRVRMIVASFLVKDLHIDWRKGEKYFAQKLVDYDPAVNNGNWQWCASTGADAQPYFRIFNPWLQQKKFDSKCEYIKKWVPELKNETPSILHNLFKDYVIEGYPKPIVDHAFESRLAKAAYKRVK